MRFANVKFGFAGAKKNPFGIPLPELGVSELLGLPNFGDINKRINESKKKEETGSELGDSYNRELYNRDFRNMLMTDSALRQYELGREADRNMRSAQQYFQMAGAGQESAARRRLMEDQFSPTKISQQRLRAQTGEAALMDAVARQGNTAVNIATAGLAPRGRAGGR